MAVLSSFTRVGTVGKTRIVALSAIAGAATLGLGLMAAPAAYAADTSFVPDSAISSVRATTQGWFAEETAGGDVSVSTAPDGSTALEMAIPSPSSSARTLFTYGVAQRPSDLASIVADASYVYTGLNVNFQLEFFYTPVDPAYGPAAENGGNKCTQATDEGAALPGYCYGVIKYEPGKVVEGGVWETVTLGDKDTGWHGSAQPGWWPTNRIGSIAKNTFDVPLTTMLAEMDDVQVIGVGVATGSGSSALESAWVRSVSYGGTSYRFGDAPVADPVPADPPAASTDALEDFIADSDIDVEATTQTFAVGDDAPGAAVELDPTAPLDASLPWTPVGDDFVDLYAYSEPVFLGTFPVVDGAVVITGLDLSALEAGGHHLVFIGQTSQSVSIVQIAVAVAPPGGPSTGDDGGNGATAPELAETGVDGSVLFASVAALLLLGVTLTVAGRRERRS